MIVYNKLGNYLKSKNMKYIDLQRNLGLSPSVIAKFQKNRTISTETLNKICEYLRIQPSEIMEWIPDSDYEKISVEKREIEKQIAELQGKLEQIDMR